MYKKFISPILDKLDSETWHTRVKEALHLAELNPLTLKLLEQFTEGHHRFTDKRLNVNIAGIKFDNPLVVGGGWDKEGRAIRALYTLGFAGVEVGTVVAYPQPGNPKPRQFIIAPGVAINCLGFNSHGADVVVKNLKKYRGFGIPIGINLGKNKNIESKDAPEVHAIVAKKLYQDAAYFVINVSSPNTPGLRALQDKKPLTQIVKAVNKVMDDKGLRKPLFVKIAPDLTNKAVDDVIEVVVDNKLTGIIATNTTNRADLKAKYGERWRNQPGGLSGDDPEFRKMATEKISYIYKQTKGKIDIIGIGGVKDTATALEKIKAGAKIIQVVTGIRSEGPTIAGKINQGIVKYMEKEGIKNIIEIVGAKV